MPTTGARAPGRRDRRESPGSRGTTWATTPSSERTAGAPPLLPLRGIPGDVGDDDAIDGRPQYGAAELKARLAHDLAGDVGNIPRDYPVAVHALDEQAHVARAHPLVGVDVAAHRGEVPRLRLHRPRDAQATALRRLHLGHGRLGARRSDEGKHERDNDSEARQA